jgi:hypothetical protein
MTDFFTLFTICVQSLFGDLLIRGFNQEKHFLQFLSSSFILILIIKVELHEVVPYLGVRKLVVAANQSG